MVDFKNLKKNLLISFTLGIGVFLGLSIYSDVHKLKYVLITFNYRYIPIILTLAPLNYCFRYIKWNYFLKQVNIQVDNTDNMLIFTSALAMTVSPGKVGELLKSYLLKEKNNIPISTTAPLVMAERFTDGISMLILASFGALSYNYGKEILILIIVCMGIFIGFVQSPKAVYGTIGIMEKIGPFKRNISSIKNFYNNTYLLFSVKPLLFSVSIGVVSWFFEGLVIWLTLKAMDTEISILASIFIVSFSSILGAVSMIPGGLFAAEGSIMGLLIFMGVTKDIATAATIVTRFSTLWLGVFLGMVSLVLLQRKLK